LKLKTKGIRNSLLILICAYYLAEREILEKIKNPFIVDLHFAFQTEDKLYFIMDFCNGGELFYHLRRDVKFSERRACFYAAEIVTAIECLHSNGIIYR
jgi:serine/threonine protein kinase